MINKDNEQKTEEMIFTFRVLTETNGLRLKTETCSSH